MSVINLLLQRSYFTINLFSGSGFCAQKGNFVMIREKNYLLVQKMRGRRERSGVHCSLFTFEENRKNHLLHLAEIKN